MNERDFVYWLQGFVEINGTTPNDDQWKMIKEHLQTVFHKVTPMHPNHTSPFPDWNNPSPTLPNYPHHPTIIC